MSPLGVLLVLYLRHKWRFAGNGSNFFLTVDLWHPVVPDRYNEKSSVGDSEDGTACSSSGKKVLRGLRILPVSEDFGLGIFGIGRLTF